MGYLRCLSRGGALAEQDRWQRPSSAHFLSDAGFLAEVVAGRDENYVRRLSAWPALESLRGVNRRQRPSADDKREGDEGDAGWSPDGKSLLFGSMNPFEGRPAIHLLDLTTLQISTLPGSEGLFSPRWSPDGRYIVALVAVDQNKLMLYDFTTKKWAKQAEMQTGWGPNWSRDGRYIYLDNISSATEPVFVRIRISDGRMERVASLKGLRRAYGPFGTWAGLTPDNAPLVLRDTGSQEVYALAWEVP